MGYCFATKQQLRKSLLSLQASLNKQIMCQSYLKETWTTHGISNAFDASSLRMLCANGLDFLFGSMKRTNTMHFLD